MSQLILNTTQFRKGSASSNSSVSSRLHIGKYFLIFAMLFIIGALSLFYLIKFTEIHTKGYQLRKLEVEKNRLMAERQTQTSEIARLRSLNAIAQSSVARRMVNANATVFVIGDSAIAQLPKN